MVTHAACNSELTVVILGSVVNRTDMDRPSFYAKGAKFLQCNPQQAAVTKQPTQQVRASPSPPPPLRSSGKRPRLGIPVAHPQLQLVQVRYPLWQFKTLAPCVVHSSWEVGYNML